MSVSWFKPKIKVTEKQKWVIVWKQEKKMNVFQDLEPDFRIIATVLNII